MMPLRPETLPDLSQGFLLAAEVRPEGQGVLVQGGYDAARFDPELFETLGIDRPSTLTRAIHKRLAEFLAGRAMAQLAQAALGHAPQQVTPGSNRAPIWPAGLAGSISHARGHCAALVLPSKQGAPGIDIEAIAEGHALDSILRVTVTRQEEDLIATAPDPALVATLCFSAKEALFKALYPTVGRHFGFTCAALRTLPSEGQLHLHLTETLHPDLPEGRAFSLKFEAQKDRVLTWLVTQGN